ncbi:aspartic peptidase A1 [Mycena latifolia]|nr:aspartic peptidase A1 [Mycena latifolia]
MVLHPLFLALLPLLEKAAPVLDNRELEYGAPAPPQAPFPGAGGSGRRVFRSQAHFKRDHRVPPDNFMNAQYYANIELYSAAACCLPVILDTGSAKLWVPSSQCTSIAYLLHSKYDSSRSSTYKANGSESSFKNGSGSTAGFVSSFVSNDVLAIGDLKIVNQDFAEATTEPGLTFAFGNVNHITPPLYNMVDKGLIDQPIVSFRLGSSEQDGGEVVFGEINPEAYTRTITYAPVRRKGYWEVELEKVTLGDDELELEDIGAAIDTGATLIALPTDIAELTWGLLVINAQIGAKRSENGQYTVNCAKISSLLELAFFFDGRQYPLKGSDYILNVLGITLSSFSHNHLNRVIGDTFLRKYYTVYDLGRDAAGFTTSI